MDPIFIVRKCINPECGLRYTLPIQEGRGKRCPACHSEADTVGEPFCQLDVPRSDDPDNGPAIEILLDNIRSAWNVGSILRSSDGAGIRKIHLCGVSPRPDSSKVAKTALGAAEAVPWEYHADGLQACNRLLGEGYRIWALEGGPGAQNLCHTRVPVDRPILLVVGNELTGIDPGILGCCEKVLFLPMAGMKGSLNVAVAFAAAVYWLRFTPALDAAGGKKKG